MVVIFMLQYALKAMISFQINALKQIN